ncbi:hypothetical protein SUSAZ_08915 [Sulfolobus acidocaldarius SUSAZ]|nr:hypothetical protein SUSAZ_08915 [Sulfolobus acidocaldarius SUSAZ]
MNGRTFSTMVEINWLKKTFMGVFGTYVIEPP